MLKKSTHQDHTTGVLLEYIDSKLDLVIEGHGTLDKKIDDVNEKDAKIKNSPKKLIFARVLK